MEDPIEFGELSHDEDFKSKIRDFEGNLNEVREMLENFCSLNVYEKLTPADKVRYELFQAFAINSLYWFYLRVKGIDPNQHEIRSEINRIRDFMARSKKIYEKQTLMPKLDQEAAKRFIRSGLWDLNECNNNKNKEQSNNLRKRKRVSDEDEDEDNEEDDKDDLKSKK